MVDCRELGFSDGSQAVNYLTSHDTGGDFNVRLHNYLEQHEVMDKAPRFRLGFTCLLTAVGIPMILAGDEFADAQDVCTEDRKEVDPVSFQRLEEPWRCERFTFVSRLVRLRTSSDALAANDTEFIHWDEADGRRVVAWTRGADASVVVVANFSDWSSDGADYDVSGFPDAAAWWDVGHDRAVEPGRAGHDMLAPWDVNVYQQRPL
jgi:hypothetical protein